MEVPRGFRLAITAVASLALAGCLPASRSRLDEEKEPHYLTGKSRVTAMDYKGAVESFSRALEVNPRSGAAHLELGWLCDQKEGDPAAAIYHYERYLALRPNAENTEMVKTRILACKQELARTVSLGPVTQTLQREFENLVNENKRLKTDLEACRALLLTLQAVTNQLTAVAARASAGPAPGAALQQQTGQGVGGRRPALGPSVSPGSRTHTVQSGETLTMIARRYGIRLQALTAANPSVDPRRLRPGQILNVPSG